MKTFLNLTRWTGTLCLIAAGLLYFQCPEPIIPTPTPIVTPLPRLVTPLPRLVTPLPRLVTPLPRLVTPLSRLVTPLPRLGGSLPSEEDGFVKGLIQGLLVPLSGATYGVVVRTPADWQVEPLTHTLGFSVRSPDGRSGMNFGIDGFTSGGTCSDSSSFPWPQDAQLEQRLSQRGITATEVVSGMVDIFGDPQPAYFWGGGYYWPVGGIESRTTPKPLTSRGCCRLQEEDYIGFITAVPYGQAFLEIVGFALTEEWEETTPYFSAILASLEEPPANWTPRLPAAAGEPPSPTAGWSSSMSISSGGPGYSVRYPPDWIRPERLQDGAGFQQSSADRQSAVVVRIQRGGDPAALLASWQAPGLTNPVIEEGELVTVTDVTAPIRIARGQDVSGGEVTAGAAYVQSGAYVLEVVWSAPSGEAWDGAQQTFAGILASIRIWTTEADVAQYGLSGMMISYPADWRPAAAPDGEGLWASAVDGAMGLVVWVRVGGDPAAMLAAWDGTDLSGIGDFTRIAVEDSGSVYVLGGQQPSRSWQGQDDSGAKVQGSVIFVRHEGAALEVVWYAPAERWSSAGENIFSNLNTMLLMP